MMFCSYKTKIIGEFIEVGEIAVVILDKSLIYSKTINRLPSEQT